MLEVTLSTQKNISKYLHLMHCHVPALSTELSQMSAMVAQIFGTNIAAGPVLSFVSGSICGKKIINAYFCFAFDDFIIFGILSGNAGC